MQSFTKTRATSPKVWAGRVVSALPVLFLLFDGSIKLARIAPVEESFARLGFRPDVAVGVGIVELACLAVYLFPRTSLAGAALLSGFLGGAVALHLRVGDPLLTHVLFPFYVGALLWGGLLLRDGSLGSLLFLRTSAAR